MAKLSDLAQLAIDASGGLDRWRQFDTVSARLLNGGVLWPLKHQQGVLDDVRVRVGLREEWASHWPFGAPGLRTSFQPHRVAIEDAEGRHVEELPRPRDSFKGHSLETPWSRLQLAYFAGYAMWTYLNTPFLLAWDGVETEEVEPWREDGEVWRRLKVTFPPGVASHSTVQTFYFDAEGLLQRHDYDTEVLGGTPAAHYVYQHEEFSGILVPTRRRVLGRAPDGTSVPEPLIVTIDLIEVEFS
ncbi:MAG TPA: hypothetical protein VIQ24_18380 [Pyrinomonadaceae bacterium]